MTNQQALIEIAREIEALKRPCGMDPESPIAIQNGRYMSLSYKIRELAAPVEAQQPAPSAASKAVLAAIRAANMQLVRTGDDEFMLVTYKNARAQCDGGKCGIGGYCDDCPTPQADSQPAQVEVADAMADSQYLAGVSAGWNAANADDPNEALRKLHESRAGYLKPIRAAAPKALDVGSLVTRESAIQAIEHVALSHSMGLEAIDMLAAAVAATDEADTVDLVGVRATGEHVNLGKIAMPPRMTAREIARSYFGHFEDEDGSDAELCFGALETLLDWLSKQGWEPNLKPIQGVHPAVSKTLVNQLLEALEISRVLKADYDSLENYGVASRKHAKAIADARAYVATPPAQAAESVLEDAALLKEARCALWQPANAALCERIDAYLDAARKQGGA